MKLSLKGRAIPDLLGLFIQSRRSNKRKQHALLTLVLSGLLLSQSNNAIAQVAPNFTSNPVTSAEQDQLYSYSVQAIDADDDPIIFAVKEGTSLPSWLKLGVGSTQPNLIAKGIISPGGAGRDEQGNTYVAELNGSSIFKIAPNRVKSPFATVETSRKFGLLVHDGYLYISYYDLGKITRIELSNPQQGERNFTSLSGPLSMTVKDGAMYVAQYRENKISKIDMATQAVSTYTTLTRPFGLGFDSKNNLFIASYGERSIYKYGGVGGQSVKVADFSNDGNVRSISDIKVDANDNLYISTYGTGVKKLLATDLTKVLNITTTGNVWSMTLSSEGVLGWAANDEGKVYSLSTGAVLTGTPSNIDIPVQPGNTVDYPVCLTAADSTANSEQCFTITATNTNDSPVITSNSGGDMASININENLTAVTQVAATDVDVNDTVSYSLVAGKDSEKFQLDSAGNLTFKSAPDFETPTDSDGNNSYLVDVRADDKFNGHDIQQVTVTITDVVNELASPVFTSTPVLSAKQDQLYSYNVQAIDANHDPITFAVKEGTSLPSWLKFEAGSTQPNMIAEGIKSSAGIARDEQGNTYVAEAFSSGILKIAPNGDTSSFATVNKDAKYAILVHDGYLYIAYFDLNKITRVELSDPNEGEQTFVDIDSPFFMVVKNGAMYVSQHLKGQISKIDMATHEVSEYTKVSSPSGLGFDSNNNLFIAGFNEEKIYKYDGGEELPVVVADFSNDESVEVITDIIVDANDNLYFGTFGTGVKKLLATDLTKVINISTRGNVWGMVLSSEGTLGWVDDSGDGADVYSLSIGAMLTGTPSNTDIPVQPGNTVGFPVCLTASDGTASESTEQCFTISAININDAPTISGTPATSVKEDVAYSFKPNFYDVDKDDTLKFSIVNKPTWAVFNTATGELSGTPTNSYVGSTSGIVISVSDLFTAKASLPAFSLTVENTNDVPTISGTPATSVKEDAAYRFKPTFNDVDKDDTHTFSIANKPDWASFNTQTGELSGTPNNDNVGSTQGVVITVTDSDEAATSLPAFSLTVENTNDAPTISGTPATSVKEDAAYRFKPTFNDVDKGDTHTFSIVNKPNWTTFNAQTGELSGTPNNDSVGSTQGIVITVTDSDEAATSLPAFTLTVENTNDAPTISGSPATSVKEDAAYRFKPTFNDVDKDDTHTFSIANKPDWASFNTQTGELSGTPNNDNVGSTQGIVIMVTDSDEAATSLPAFSLTVENTNDVPTISGTPVTSVKEDAAYRFKPTFNDVDKDDTHTFSIANKPDWASFNAQTGELSGTPNNDSVGSTQGIVITITDSDEAATSLPAFTLTVENTNDAPTGNDVELSVKEGEALKVDLENGLMVNAKDDDLGFEDRLIVLLDTRPSYGTLTLNVDGSYEYTHGGSENHQDSFTFYYQDKAKAESAKYTATIKVEAVEDAPNVVDDLIELTEDTSSEKVNLLVNDSDPENNMVESSLTIVKQPSKGTVSIENGVVVYTANENENGDDSFTYTVKDSTQAVSKEATVQVKIKAVNDAPRAADFTVNISEDTASEVLAVRDKATDVEDGKPTKDIRITQAPTKGKVSIDQAAGTFIYTPNANENKEDSFKYVIADGDGVESNEATVSINIGAVNDLPVVGDDSVTTNEDEGVTLAILSNDQDIEDTNFAASSISLQNNGDYDLATATVGDDGVLAIMPKQDKNGKLSFTYTVADSEGLRSLPATVEVEIKAVNDAPVAKDNTAQIKEDGSIEINVLGNDVDVDSELAPNSVTMVTQPRNGTAKVIATGAIVYTSKGDFFGEDSFTYTVKDAEGLVSNPAKVNIIVDSVNDRPVISGTPSTSVDEDQVYRFTPRASDIEGDTLTFSIQNQPTWADFDATTGELTGTPTEGLAGSYDGIEITVTDGNTEASLAPFAILVNAVNDAPVISGTPILTVQQDQVYSFAPAASDVDSLTLTFAISNQPNWATFDTETGLLTGTPERDNVGRFSNIVISVSDGELSDSLAAFSIDVLAVNAAPVANNMQQTVKEDGTVSFVANISDIDGDALTIQLQNQPQHGQIAVQNDIFTYTPTPQFNGTDSFSFIASDDELSSEAATVTMTVTSVNDLPVAVDDSYTFTSNATGQYSLTVLDNDTDLDGDALRIVGAKTSIGSITIDGDVLNLQVADMTKGQAVVTYLVEDLYKGRDEAIAEISIDASPSNVRRPTITAPQSITVNATGLFTKVDLGTAIATDSDGNALPVSLASGQPIFAPGRHTVYWQAKDGQGQQVVASQEINVNPLVSIQKDSKVSEDKTYRLEVYLNGTAPSYPVTIPYSVLGSADMADHDLQSGEFVITSGTQASIEFTVFADSEVENNETIEVILGDELNVGANSTTTITIVEQNVAPTVRTIVTQNGEERSLVTATDAQVSITAQVSDVNSNDQVSVVWHAPVEFENNSSTTNVFTFNPQVLPNGIYKVEVIASDNASPSLSTRGEVFIEVVESLAALSSDIDSDGDLIPDSEEGYQDSDNDGIPDYLDNIDACNVLPQQVSESSQYLVEGEPGVCLRKGVTVAQNQTGGAQLNASEIPVDHEATNIGGIFDYVAVGLPKEGDIYRVVIPQRKPIPSNAVYRKFNDGQWSNFVIDENNKVLSARGELGFCPPPGDAQWTIGMDEGDYCVQLQIKDGGPNDDDGVANATVVDPGGVAVTASNNILPIANSDTVTVLSGQSETIDVLANDTDEDGNTLTLISASVDFGQVSVINNQLSYSAPKMFLGVATIQYGITDSEGGTAQSTVAVSIVNNQAPITKNDSASSTGNMLKIDVLANDLDPEGSALTLVSASATHGSVEVQNNVLHYLPASGFEGVDLLYYVMSDEHGATAEGEVSVTVTLQTNGKTTSKVENRSSGSMGVLSLLLVSALFIRRSKTALLAFALASTVSLVSTSTLAGEWKVNGSVGTALADSTVANDTLANTYLDDKSNSWSIGAFYQFAPHWDVGVRYLNLGKGRADFKGETVNLDEMHNELSKRAPVLPEGGALQVGYGTDLVKKVTGKLFIGVFDWKSEINSLLNGQANIHHKQNGLSGYIGTGIHYSLTDSIKFGVDYSHYFISVNDIDEISAIISYRF
ncbi:Virginiamycin B lyase [Pseudoalteromonas holothuriae]|uniref:Virginiamycin B lyase n=1 Tax=Pseudoalteromonas holothuriae TaxID=2963714 RepID=A0ABM9GE36_9GAMM|nr:Ig-like domain-containing protein [Pseudoalteromonas sp. CIP111951]CAH9050682.1 Virginiamycin B lyase [Pseudoalteromonas sp. CIP111951]